MCGERGAVAVWVRRGGHARSADAALRPARQRRGHRRQGGVAGDGGDTGGHGAGGRRHASHREERGQPVVGGAALGIGLEKYFEGGDTRVITNYSLHSIIDPPRIFLNSTYCSATPR